MEDLQFLEHAAKYDEGNATLKAVLDSGEVCHISDTICAYKFLDNCPLLFHAFEYGNGTRQYASITAPSRSALVSLVRYCYTGNYLPPDADYEPILLLPHAEIYKMATDFDVPALQLLSNANFTSQTEFCCCLPYPPQDLLETITFIYKHYADQNSRQQHNMVDSLLNYCISQFNYHNLGENKGFLGIISSIPDFHRDLCRTNMKRNFEDDCAFHIVRLALDALHGYSGDCPTMLASRPLPEEMLLDPKPETEPQAEEANPASNESSRRSIRDSDSAIAFENKYWGNAVADLDPNIEALKGKTWADLSYTYKEPEETQESDDIPIKLEQVEEIRPDSPLLAPLVYRPKSPRLDSTMVLDSGSSSDEDGFSLVHRPKPLFSPAEDEVMSNSEPTSAPPVDVLPSSSPAADDVMSSLELTSPAADDIISSPETISLTDDDIMSSPELIPTPPVDVLAASGSNYPSDDEWDLVDME